MMFPLPSKLSRLGASGLLWASIFVPALALAAKEFVMPTPGPAGTYAAHDEHAGDRISIAIDRYDEAKKASIFSVHYLEYGFLPIFLVVTNDGDQPAELVDMKAEVVAADRTKLESLEVDDIRRRVTRPLSRRQYPLPFPTKKVKGGLSAKDLNEIERAQFGARAVEPHSTQAGFLFFDVSDLPGGLGGARFYLTGVRNSQGREVIYFEVPLDPPLPPH
jgi:hypothetical protein